MLPLFLTMLGYLDSIRPGRSIYCNRFSCYNTLGFLCIGDVVDATVQPARTFILQCIASCLRDIILCDISWREHHAHHSHHSPTLHVPPKTPYESSRRTCPSLRLARYHRRRVCCTLLSFRYFVPNHLCRGTSN